MSSPEQDLAQPHLFAAQPAPPRPSAPPPPTQRSLVPEGPAVDVRPCVEPGTGLALVVSSTLAVLGCLFLIVTVYGALIAVAGIVANWFIHRRARALLRGSALQIGPRQFPELHACATSFASVIPNGT